MASRWAELSVILRGIDFPLVIVSVALAILANACAVFAWGQIWPGFGIHFSLRASIKYFFVSQAGKYLPGSVWSIAAQAQLTTRWRIPVLTSVIVGLLALAVSMMVALVIGSASVLFLGDAILGAYWWVSSLALAAIVALSPPVMTRLIRLVLRVLRRPASLDGLSWARTARVTALNVGFWVIVGTHFWVILVALGADPLESLLPAIAGFAIAFALGVLFVPAPAGAGVREAALVFFLAESVGPTDALAAALVSRVVLAAVDIGLAGIGASLSVEEGAVQVNLRAPDKGEGPQFR
ncbi:lysylphosphatidylglycerol synthase domain-containing protein [Chryseoglobus sp. 28M-23]|uniref:lysylphosphatidylglycerol synthase domain-containing protein n=1 Tax=Chryseoglobus sp. 28M-23 TaxID=2772253 RepID=UPI001746F580|nr:lysylphosphatidylglycerol synthase domain-containing protein [Chryseoglobus sp. 28M-23]QOD93253.1 flippase-like domain-containing protein [Chryseoglobus sp. 28M-23]